MTKPIVRRFLRASSLAILVVALLPALMFASGVAENKPGKGDPAPLFVVQDLDGNKVSLEEIVKSGKVVFLNFWGLRCSACIEEIGYLNPMHEKFKGKDVVFLGVNVDGAKAEVIKAQMPNMQHQPKFTVLPDPEFKIPDMYNLAGAPLSFVIGKDGVVKYRHEDFKPGDEKEIEEAIRNAVVRK
jgi:peroxiredoxin